MLHFRRQHRSCSLSEAQGTGEEGGRAMAGGWRSYLILWAMMTKPQLEAQPPAGNAALKFGWPLAASSYFSFTSSPLLPCFHSFLHPATHRPLDSWCHFCNFYPVKAQHADPFLYFPSKCSLLLPVFTDLPDLILVFVLLNQLFKSKSQLC